MNAIGVIILAAGGSVRMGRPKQFLPWGSSTLLRQACLTALATLLDPIILVLGNEAEACVKEVHDLPLHIVVHQSWTDGLGSSLGAGVAALEAYPNTEAVLVLLADQPTVTTSWLMKLVTTWSSSEMPIVATAYDGDGGVPAMFDRSYFLELMSLEKERGARSLIQREKAFTLLLDPGEPLIDIDTPANYAKCLKSIFPPLHVDDPLYTSSSR